MLRAIIFDMDGVIVDSEILDFTIQKEFIRSENGSINEEDLRELVGKSYNDLYETMLQFIGYKYSLNDLIDKFSDFSMQKYKKTDYKSLFREDIIDILKYAKSKELQLAVASSSEENHIRMILKECDILDYFDVIVSGERFLQSKPHPEIYLYTLDKLNVSAEETIAIEDSYSGILAAKSAEIPVIAYEETRMPVDQTMADYIGQNMTEILKIVGSLN